jgi:hypothetical protein
MSEDPKPTLAALEACEKRAVENYYLGMPTADARAALVVEFGEACVARMLEIGIGRNVLPEEPKPEEPVRYFATKAGNNADQWLVVEDSQSAYTVAVTYNDPGGLKAHLFAASAEMRDAIGELLEDRYLSSPINRDRMAKVKAAFDKSRP